MAVTILVSIGAMINMGSTSPTPRLYVDPPRVTAKAGQTFTVDIMVENVEDLFSWQVMMLFGTGAELECQSITYGDFLDQPRYGSLLGSDAAAGENQVIINQNPTYFSGGMQVLIHDDNNNETNTVLSRTGYYLTMANNLANTYTVAANGQVDTYPGTTPSDRIQSNWLFAGEMTSLPASGADGSGWLATIEFLVESATETDLDISTSYPDYTYLIDSHGIPILPFTPEDGRYIPPPPEDLNEDRWIDVFDLCQCAIHYGETDTPGWIPEDFTGPTPYTPDGIVDLHELYAIADKYGSVL